MRHEVLPRHASVTPRVELNSINPIDDERAPLAHGVARPPVTHGPRVSELQPVRAHPSTRPLERPAATERAEAPTEQPIHSIEQCEKLKAVCGIEPRPSHESRRDVEAVEVDGREASVPLRDLDTGKPKRVVTAEVGRGSRARKSGLLRPKGSTRPLARLREDRPDARGRRRENVESTAEK